MQQKLSRVLWLLLFLTVQCEKDKPAYSFHEKEILRLINEHRVSIGQLPLEMNRDIYEQAKNHSTNMARGLVTFGHDGFNERFNAIKKAIPNVIAGAENILYGPDTPEAVVEGWLRSDDHKKNIEGDYSYTGIASAEDKDGNLFYTQIFIKTE